MSKKFLDKKVAKSAALGTLVVISVFGGLALLITLVVLAFTVAWPLGVIVLLAVFYMIGYVLAWTDS